MIHTAVIQCPKCSVLLELDFEAHLGLDSRRTPKLNLLLVLASPPWAGWRASGTLQQHGISPLRTASHLLLHHGLFSGVIASSPSVASVRTEPFACSCRLLAAMATARGARQSQQRN